MKEIYTEAAQILHTHGWCRYYLECNGEYCLVGALKQACHNLNTSCALSEFEPLRQKINNDLLDKLGILQDESDDDSLEDYLINWNDQLCRTAREVIALLEACATDKE